MKMKQKLKQGLKLRPGAWRRGRKYWLKLAASVTILSILIVVASTWIIYYNSQRTILSVQEQANVKVLSQIDRNIEYMHQMLKQLATNTYFDSDTTYLLQMRSLDWGEVYPKLARLEKIVASTSFLESITLFNGQFGCYLSTGYTGGCRNDGLGQQLAHYLAANEYRPPKHRLIPMPAENAEDGRRLERFLYLMYDTAGASGKPGIMALTIKPQWLQANLMDMRDSDTLQTTDLLILDERGVTVHSSADHVGDEEIGRLLAAGIGKTEPGRSSIERVGGQKKILNVLPSTVAGWTIVSLQPYDQVFRAAAELRFIFTAALSLLILLGILSSLWMARRLYRPVQAVLQQLSEDSPVPAKAWDDEFAYIQSRYIDTVGRLRQFKASYEGGLATMQSYRLRRWLSDSASVDAEDIEAVFPGAGDGGYLLAMLKLDDLRQFQHGYTAAEQRLIRFAVCNIGKEILSRSYTCEVTDTRSDHFAILIRWPDGGLEGVQRPADALREVQDTLAAYYRISLTAVVDESRLEASELTAAYTRLHQVAQYRFVYGRRSILTAAEIGGRERPIPYQFPPEADKKLTEGLKSGQAADLTDLLRSQRDEMRTMPYTYIVHALLHIVNVIAGAVRDINDNGLQPIAFDLKRLYDDVFERETLDEAIEVLELAVHELCAGRQQDKTALKNKLLIETIKEMIEDHLADDGLGLQFVADMTKMSGAQANKIFKEATGLPVHEYIHEVRLARAKEMLETGDRTVLDIMQRVGFRSPSYFFRLFKKKYGVTPKEYRVRTIIGP